MTDNKKGSSFGIGVLIGTILGGLAAFFFSPNSGEENREIVAKKIKEVEKWLDQADIPGQLKEIYGEVSDEGIRLYKQVAKELKVKLNEAKKAIDNFDGDKYQAMVGEAVDKVRKETDATIELADKLKRYLVNKWDELKDISEKDIKKAVKKRLKKS
ncbi:hypothetical protein HY214_04075 [Candidatus Roizmanbacteria bacterium]|nr:hypothetical protein [Candidatus Roizmanbacteria bacterium]